MPFFLMVCRFLVFDISFSLLFVLPTEVVLSAILFPIKSPAASAVSWTTLLEAFF